MSWSSIIGRARPAAMYWASTALMSATAVGALWCRPAAVMAEAWSVSCTCLCSVTGAGRGPCQVQCRGEHGLQDLVRHRRGFVLRPVRGHLGHRAGRGAAPGPQVGRETVWAFSSLRASPGADAHYRRRRDHGDWHASAGRADRGARVDNAAARAAHWSWTAAWRTSKGRSGGPGRCD